MKKLNLLFFGLVVILTSLMVFSGCGGQGENYLRIQGSDTMVNMGQDLAETYMNEVDPEATISVTGGGSGTGIAALINDDVDIAQASRKMSESEIEEARANGVEVYEFIVGQDGLAVMINEANPNENLIFSQLKDIFTGKTTHWSELGWEEGGEITVYSRQSTSGTYVYFNNIVMDGEDWADGALFMSGSSALAEGVVNDKGGIGYSGVGYVREGLKAVNVALDEDSKYFTPLEKENIDSGNYPIARPLFFYTNGLPEGLTLEYLEWVLSPAGQQVISKQGFYELTPEYASKNQENLN